MSSLPRLPQREIVVAVMLPGVFALLCILPAVKTAGQQGQERMIVKKLDFNPPVKITGVRTKKGVIKTDEKFVDDDDWFKGLTVSVTNTSGRPVTYIDVEVLYQRPQDQAQEPPFVTHLEYGRMYKWPEKSDPPKAKPILPGRTIDLAISETDFDYFKSSLRELGYPAGLKGIEVRVIEVGYDDDTLWSGGRMWRRDPKAPKGWSLIEEKISGARGDMSESGSKAAVSAASSVMGDSEK